MCEDYPCCGHERGDCPTLDSEGNERWTCVVCGKRLPLNAPSSICAKCQERADEESSDEFYDRMDNDHSMDY
jgi:hypothetical protein